MAIGPNPRARLLVALPAERYRLLSPEGRIPRIGDMLVLDQGFTGSDGLPMVIAYFSELGGGDLYEAEVYESELEQRQKLHGQTRSNMAPKADWPEAVQFLFNPSAASRLALRYPLFVYWGAQVASWLGCWAGGWRVDQLR